MRDRVKRTVLAVTLASGALAAAGATRPAGAAMKTATFDVTAVHAGPGVSVSIDSKVWVTSTQARADVNHPLQGPMTFIVTDGYFYQFSPKAKQGIKSPLPADFKKQPDRFDLLVSKFTFDAAPVLSKAKKVRTESVSGYQCDVLTASETEGTNSKTITVWMPQSGSPKFPLKAIMSEKLQKPGASIDQSVTITLSNVKMNVPIPASQWKVPAGIKIKTVSRADLPKPAAGK